jgi:hypothetical protein
MKKEMLPDFSDFFRARVKQKVLLTRTFVAIDESLNLPEIQSLIESLLSQHLMTGAKFMHEIRNEAVESSEMQGTSPISEIRESRICMILKSSAFFCPGLISFGG